MRHNASACKHGPPPRGIRFKCPRAIESQPSLMKIFAASRSSGDFRGVGARPLSCMRPERSDADLTTTYSSADQRVSGDDAIGRRASISNPASYLVEARERDIDVRMSVDAGHASGRGNRGQRSAPRSAREVVSLQSAGPVHVELRSSEHRGKQWHGTAARRALAAHRGRGPGRARARIRGLRQSRRPDRGRHEGILDDGGRPAARSNRAFRRRATTASRAQAEYTLGHLEYLLTASNGSRRSAPRKRATDAYEELDDDVGIHNAATLRAASELEVASGMNASTQRAEQRALYDAADRRLSRAEGFFEKRALPFSTEYAVNMRGIRAFYVGEVRRSRQTFCSCVEMARANADPGEEVAGARESRLDALPPGLHRRGHARVYEQLLPLIERIASRRCTSAIARQLRFLPGRARRLRPRARRCTPRLDRGRARPQRLRARAPSRGARRPVFPHRRHAALARVRCAPRSSSRNASAMRSRERAALRVAGNAASALEPARSRARISAQVRARSTSIRTAPRARACSSRANCATLGDLRGAEAELARALRIDETLSRARTYSKERGRLRIAQKRLAEAIEDLRGADRQFATLDLDFNRIDTNTALSQALLASRDVRRRASPPRTRRSSIVRRHPREVRQPGVARAFPLGALFALRGAHRGRLCRRRQDDVSVIVARVPDRRGSARAFARGSARRAARAGVAGAGPQGRCAARTAHVAAIAARGAHAERQDVDEQGARELRRAIVETRAQIDAHRVRQASVAAGDVHTDRVAAGPAGAAAAPTPRCSLTSSATAPSHAWLLTRRELRHTVLAGRAAMQRVTDSFVAAQRRPGAPSCADARCGGAVVRRLLDGRCRETACSSFPTVR